MLDVMEARIKLASLSPVELWRRLESLCRDNNPETPLSMNRMVHVCDVVRALSLLSDQRSELVLAILSEDAEDWWPRGLGVQLAGELRIEAAAPQNAALRWRIQSMC